MPDMTPVTAADGAVLGWMSAPDPDEPDVGYFEADRVPKAGRRAAVIDEVAGLMPGEDFDLDVAHDVTGVPWADLDSAAYVALVLAEAERYGALGED